MSRRATIALGLALQALAALVVMKAAAADTKVVRIGVIQPMSGNFAPYAQESEPALVLRRSKRYAHTVSSIEALCRSAGFSSCTIEKVDLRFERKVPIEGFIAIAGKN